MQAPKKKMRMRRDIWRQFAGGGYRLEDLGRPAIFFLPVRKLKKKIKGMSIEKKLHRFLISNFGAYTSSIIPSFGFWRSMGRAVILDECRQYEVSFLGKNCVPVLIRELARIAALVREECIYLKAGQYSCLVYPRKGVPSPLS
jgi:hypothetical protein